MKQEETNVLAKWGGLLIGMGIGIVIFFLISGCGAKEEAPVEEKPEVEKVMEIIGTLPFDPEKALTDPRYRIKSKGTLGPGGMPWEKWDALPDGERKRSIARHYLEFWAIKALEVEAARKKMEELNK